MTKISTQPELTATDLAALDKSMVIDASAGSSGTKKIYAASLALGLSKLLQFEDTGGDDAYVVSTGLSLTTLPGNFAMFLKVATANTGACTLAVDSVAAKAIKVVDGDGVRDPKTGEIAAGMTALFGYNGTYFILLNAVYPRNGIIEGTNIVLGAEDYGTTISVNPTAGVRGAIMIGGTGDAVSYNDIEQRVSNDVYATLNDTDVYQWQLSLRKDGRFSQDDTHGATWELYAHRKNSTEYFAPVLFRADGELILVGAKQSVVGGYTANNKSLMIGEYIASTSSKVKVKNDNSFSNFITFYDGSGNAIVVMDANGKMEFRNTSAVTLASINPSIYGHAGFGRSAISGAVIATKDVNGDGISIVNYDSSGTETSRISADGTIKGTQFRLSALNTAPASAAATGTLGEIRVDTNYIYICVATNTWKRVAIATW